MLIQRKIFTEIWENIDSDKILFLNGARQTGKTTLLKMIKDKLIAEKNIAEKNILWYDLERTEHLEIWSSQTNVLSFLPVSEKEKYYVFIDEFQKSKNIGSILKLLHDHYHNFKIIVTGSASWYLNIDESLAGRKLIFSIWPFSFEEYMSAHGGEIFSFYQQSIKTENFPPIITEKINRTFVDFLTYGGYPEVALESKKEKKSRLLEDLINSYLTRDIQIWNYAANTLQIKTLLSLLAGQIGSLLKISTLSGNAGLGRAVLINRLELLENTFILHLVRPYFTNKIKELTKNPKVFLVDTGLHNALLANFSINPKTPDFGRLSENFAAAELFKKSKGTERIYFWRTSAGQEVDLVKKQDNILIPIEVKSGNENNIPSGLKSFIDKYGPKKAYVLNWSVIKKIRFKNTDVYFRPFWYPV